MGGQPAQREVALDDTWALAQARAIAQLPL
jgi:hypothetical protein